MQYLITGAAGFIGSFLCHKLAKEGNKIIAIDNFSSYYDVELKNNRVKELLEPLNIDVVNFTNNFALYIQRAMAPAVINSIEIELITAGAIAR